MTGDARLSRPYAHAVSTLPTWGEYLRMWRMSKKMTQEELAAAAGVSVTTIINQEGKGQKPTFDNLAVECEALGIPLMDAIKVIYRLDDQKPADPLPHELNRLVSVYPRLGSADQRRLLDSIGIVCDWAEPIAAARSRVQRAG